MSKHIWQSITAQWGRGLAGLGMIIWLVVGATGPANGQQAGRPVAAQSALYRARFEQHAAQLYTQAGLGPLGLSLPVFREALVGYYNLRAAAQRAGRGKRRRPAGLAPVLTVIDFARPSTQKRLWVIQLQQGRVLFHTLVAHGRGSGDVEPVAFSDLDGSNQSSLGFYRTDTGTYRGKHGLSLKIQGLDPDFNRHAESRAVVVHGAEYVCEEFIRQHGHLGRSQGCPALPVAETKAIIEAIKGHSILYLHGPEAAGFHSPWLDMNTAVEGFASK